MSSAAERARLTAALEYVRDGEHLCCDQLDRLARSVAHLMEIIAELKREFGPRNDKMCVTPAEEYLPSFRMP